MGKNERGTEKVMQIIDPSFEIIDMPDGADILKRIELAGRTCYKSEDKITANSAEAFVRRIIKSGHHSVLEHVTATVRIICDRGVSHELVRHRIGIAFSQASTRYCNYSKYKFGHEITVIRPMWWDTTSIEYQLWENSMAVAEYAYMTMLEHNSTPQQARSVLPNSLATEIVVTANMREWRHIFALRCDTAAHPQMRQIMIPIMQEFHKRCPAMFDDMEVCKNNVTDH